MPIKRIGFDESGSLKRRVKNRLASRIPHAKSLATTVALAAAGLLLAGSLGLTVVFAWYSRDLPDPNTLLERAVPQSTKIYDRTGETLLYEIHGQEKRTLIPISEVPDVAIWATVAVEDKTFYTHRGINLGRILKAIVIDVLSGRKAQGASTLTQQFVKNAILTNEKRLDRKLKEIILALQIERRYSKDQILQLYFNEIPYGSTLYGIESASQSYFGKRAKDLALDEAALLAALPQAPDFYSPYGTGSRGDNRDKLVQRRNLILDLMVEQKYVTREQADEAKAVDTLKKLLPKKIGEIKAPHFVTYVRSQLIETYGQRQVEQGGLNVITSLDWKLQQIAEEEVRKGVEERGERYGFTNSALVALDPKTGQILSMVGSKDFFDTEHDGQVNVTIRPRQPGSSFKPIVYTAGFLKGYTPEMALWDVNTVFKSDPKDYEPKNYDLKEHGPVSARMALQGSLNIPAVKMLYLVGVGRVLDFAESLGYTTFANRSRFGLSLVLGGGEVMLLEHANAYAAFANQGVQHPITAILKIEDAGGKTLEEWTPGDGAQAVERNAALTITNVLSDNDSRAYIFGAKNFLTLPGRAAAAKTGTTNNYHDAWTLGYTPSLVAGVWVGNNNNAEMKRGADGSVIAAPIWNGFMRRALEDAPAESFPPPQPAATSKPFLLGKAHEQRVPIDKVTGKRATPLTPPELVEERAYYEAHSELWYVDKDDPRGPAPSDPARDPQFRNWEAGVAAWVEKQSWNTTSTPPTEEDDIHTTENQPVVTILSPIASDVWQTRQPLIQASAAAPRLIRRVEARMEGVVIGTALGGSGTISAFLPNSIGVGYHDLTVTAYDDVGNRGSATVTVNLLAEPSSLSAVITSPTSGTKLPAASFPALIQISLSDVSQAKKVDLFLEDAQTGIARILATALTPDSSRLEITWTSAPAAGTYYLFPVVTTQDDLAVPGGKVTMYVE
ncbi:transglycosylase domain-containing protein [Candidatus Uhrbacteria bacterium]|nr:transglycosylase domain-containing protein [Candidatus Uhrbacteria bacterium]